MTQKANKKTLQDIAIHLSWNLHSGAGENIISSLLAASFNLSGDFKEWFLEQIGFSYSRNSEKNLYAMTNKNIEGSIVRAVQKKKSKEDKKFPARPDIVIYDSDEEKEWDKLEGSDKKKDRSNALRRIHLVVVEVKQTGLTSPDYKKYKNLINGLANLNKTGREGLLNPHRFVIVSSHTKEAKDRISETPSGKEEERWKEYFNQCDKDKRVKHLTLEKIYEEIHNHTGDWCARCPILQLFKYYLALYLCIFKDEKLHKEYWRQTIENSTSAFDLKWDIADHINWLASNASLKKKRGKGNKWDDKRARMLKMIKFSQEKYQFEYKYNEKKSTKQLKIVLGGEDHSLDTEKIRNTGDHAEIMKILKKVDAILSKQASMM